METAWALGMRQPDPLEKLDSGSRFILRSTRLIPSSTHFLRTSKIQQNLVANTVSTLIQDVVTCEEVGEAGAGGREDAL